MNSVYLNRDNISLILNDIFEKFDSAFLSAKYSCAFSAGGLGFVYRSNQKNYLDHIQKILTPDNSNNDQFARILSANIGQFDLPNLIWNDPTLDVLGLDIILKNSPYRLHIDTEYQVYSIYDRRKNLGIQLTRIENYFPPWESSGPLRIFIHWHLANHNKTIIHAGSLAIGKKGIILAGAGGSGKSSTVLSGILNGLNSVGDDYLSIEISEKIILGSIFKILKISPQRLIELGCNSRKQINWQNKVELPFSDFPSISRDDFIEAYALCLPKVSFMKKTQFLKISSSQALLGLAPSSLMQLPCDRDNIFHMAAKISRKLPCYIVELGTDGDEIANAIRIFIIGLTK